MSMSIDQILASAGGILGGLVTLYTAYNSVILKRNALALKELEEKARYEKEKRSAEAAERSDKAAQEIRTAEIAKLRDEMNAAWLERYNAENNRLHEEIRGIRKDMDELRADLVVHQRWVVLCNSRLMSAGIPMVPKPDRE